MTTIGIGIDAVDIDRFRTVLNRQPKVADRLFSEQEYSYATGFADSVPRLAVRFAVKEAVMKAMGVGIGSCRFTDIEVKSSDSGAPSLVLHNAAQKLSSERGITEWLLSLTHTNQCYCVCASSHSWTNSNRMTTLRFTQHICR